MESHHTDCSEAFLPIPAQELNDALAREHSPILQLLSQRGRAMYFPKRGILAQTAEARGKSIDATIGIALEDDRTPMKLPSIVEGLPFPPTSIVSYAPIAGDPALRHVWQEHIRSENPSVGEQRMSLPVVVGGLTHGLHTLGALFVDRGDDVIVTSPAWENYELIFSEFYGGALHTFPLFSGKRFNIEEMRQSLKGKRKKILLLNFPHNPTGYSPLEGEAQKIVEEIHVCAEEGSDVLVITDDAYFGLVYEDGVKRESLFGALANLHERVVAAKVDGASKEGYGWGLRVAFVTYAGKGLTEAAAGVLEDKTAGVVRRTVSNCSTLSQKLLLRAMQSPSYEREKEEKREILRSRFRAMQGVLSDPKFQTCFRVLPCNSGYFVCLELHAPLVAEDIRKTLLQEWGTGVISWPGNLLRIAFSAVPEGDIPRLFETIYQACCSLLSPSHDSSQQHIRCGCP